jgi:DNA-binding MarR family transcriptional regulator
MDIIKGKGSLLDIDLPILFSKMSKDFNRDYGEFLRPYGLSKIHSFYLLCLHKRPEGIKLKELSEIVGCDKANTSRALADLQDKGIVCKDTDSDIEKKYMVMLTNNGKDIADKFAELVKDNVTNVLSKLTKNEVDTLKSIINKLILN